LKQKKLTDYIKGSYISSLFEEKDAKPDVIGYPDWLDMSIDADQIWVTVKGKKKDKQRKCRKLLALLYELERKGELTFSFKPGKVYKIRIYLHRAHPSTYRLVEILRSKGFKAGCMTNLAGFHAEGDEVKLEWGDKRIVDALKRMFGVR